MNSVSYTPQKLLLLGHRPSRTWSFPRDSQVYVLRIKNSRRNAAYRHASSVVGHGEKLHDVPDEYLEDSLIVAKKIAVASGLENYNILQVRVHPHSLHCVPLMRFDPSE